MAERRIYLSAFPYTDANGFSRWAQHGETIEVGPEDLERGERLGAFEPLDTETPAEPDDGDGVPAGSIPKVLAWVGTDEDRALAALLAEEAAAEPRSTLVAQLRDLIAAE